MSLLSGEPSTATGGGIDPSVNPLGAILAAITNSQRETQQLREELRAAQEEAAEKASRRLVGRRRGHTVSRRRPTRSRPPSMTVWGTI